VITAHQRHRQTDRQTDVKRSHDRYIAKACSGKKDIKLQISLFQHYKIPTLPLHSQQDSSDIV